jgi:predicted P-loop ATPase
MTMLPSKICDTTPSASKPWNNPTEQTKARAQVANALPADAAPAEATGAEAENRTPAVMAPPAPAGAIPTASPAVEFLEKLRPGGPWVLTAIIPDGETETTTARDAKAVDAFVAKYDGECNLYYSVNPTRRVLASKAAKIDIAWIEYLLADLDPREDESPKDAKARYLDAIETHEPAITAIIDSGNGIQGLFRLSERIEIGQYPPEKDKNGKLVLAPKAAAIVKDVEERCKALMERLGSAAGTQNIDRLLRLPGTINLPNKVKRDKGRVACQTKVIRFNGATCKLADFPLPLPSEAASGTVEDAKTEIDWAKVDEHAGWLKTVDDLPDNFNAKGKMIIAHTGNIADLSTDLKRAGLIEKNYATWSAVTLALASIFKANGSFTNEQIAAALMCDLECNHHVTKQDGAQKRRAVERALDRSYEAPAKRAARALHWRECRANGAPVPSMHNARLAISALGIECSYDTFHNKLLFGYRGDSARHEMQFIVGEVTDNGIIRLRQIMSDRFGFDLGDKSTRDAVVSSALEHCFDPVRDMLDKAEAEWDGVERLDEMAVTYFNCDDTQFNRAAIRKTMIGAVRRVRRPGCKFDTIVVLESEEGWNKSSAWKIIAGDNNFSDVSILGHNAREVQEQLSEIWIHENADLAGMRKAEVESVKSFASRQIDIARAAYGHFVLKQKRHSIEVGTTNSDEYLQSQTGNRRFWPLAVTKIIDIEALKRDRLLLLGEAAKYESAGESITLDENLWPKAAAEQEKRRTKHPWESVVANLREWIDTNERGPDGKREQVQIIFREDNKELVASADLLTHVLRIPIGQQEARHSMMLAAIMKRAGWERTSNKITIGGQQVRGYFRVVPNAK